MFTHISSLVAGVELVTELLSAAVLLMALDKLATAIRWTYKAGRFAGWLWFTYGVPAVLATADGISWLNSKIDWRFSASVFFDCLKIVVVALITSVTLLNDAHRRWVGSIDWNLPTVQVAPSINPLFDVATELELMTCRQLQKMTGTRRRVAKRELIAAYVTR